MYKDIVLKAIEHFNNNEMDKLNALWHDDVQVIRLMTNDVLVSGIKELTEANAPYMGDNQVQIKLINSIEFDNIVIGFLELNMKDQDYERISVYEIIDNKIKNSWVSQFKKDEEQ